MENGVKTSRCSSEPGEVPSLSEHHISEPGEVPSLSEHHISEPGEVPNLSDHHISEPGEVPSLSEHHISEPGEVPNLSEHHISEPGEVPSLSEHHISELGEVPSLSEHHISEPGEVPSLSEHHISEPGEVPSLSDHHISEPGEVPSLSEHHISEPGVVPSLSEHHISELGEVPSLSEHHISETYGFLLERPLSRLPDYFSTWNIIGGQIHKLLENKTLRRRIDQMELVDHRRLSGHRQYRLAFTFLCFMGHGYIWQEGEKEVAKRVPRQLAVPWHGVGQYLGLRPVLCVAACALSNYVLIDENKEFTLENIRSVCSFPEAAHSDGFFLVSLIAEYKAAPGIKAATGAMKAVLSGDDEEFVQQLTLMTSSIRNVQAALALLHDNLSADIFYNQIRIFLAGWGGATSVAPEGVVFEGVSTEPLKAVGASAAQSSVVATFDAALGITHAPDRQSFLDEMLRYMPPDHAHFIRRLRAGPSIKHYALGSDNGRVRAAYEECVASLKSLRSYHMQIATKYIVVPSNKSRRRDMEGIAKRGTGGQDLIPFLRGIRDTTRVDNH